MSIRNLIELILLAALWGASFLFLRIATPEFGAIALIQVRVLVAALFLLPIWYFREAKRTKKQVQQYWRPLLVVGLLNSAIPFVLFAYSTLYITGGYASVINSTVPTWGALVAWFWLGNKPGFDSTVGLAIGIVGVIILVSGSLTGSLGGVSNGVLAALCAAFLYGVAANYTSVKLTQVSPLTISTMSLVAASLVLLPLTIVYLPTQSISLQAWIAVLAMGVFCTGFANILYFRLIANIGSTKAITVTFLIPIFGTIWGVLFINEAVSIDMLAGGGVILLGTALVTGLISFKKAG